MVNRQTVQLIRRYIPVFGPPLLIVAFFFLLVRPTYLSLNRLKKEIAAKKVDLEESRAIVAGKKQVFVVLQETQKKSAYYQEYFARLEETDILRRLAKIANRANICYTKLAPGGETKKDTISPQTQPAIQDTTSTQFDIRPYALNFKASFTQFSDVLTQLAKLDRFVTIRSFKVDTKEERGSNPQPYNPRAELTVDFYFRPAKVEGPKPEPQKVIPVSRTPGQAPALPAKTSAPKAPPPAASAEKNAGPKPPTTVSGLPAQTPVPTAKVPPPKKASLPVATPSAVQPVKTKTPISSPSLKEGGVTGEGYYTVCAGDTLIKIAHRYGMNVWELRKLNNMPKESLIKPGDKIKVK